ncbi:MAG: N-acetylmuramoyl-L-alanine amidase [Fulvivirga sp.]|nr:N-acetylmuramoyl-L-alanine amidase [Fulvivirga sp.]
MKNQKKAASKQHRRNIPRFNLYGVFFGFTEKFTILRKVIGYTFKKRKIVKNIAIASLFVAITLLTSSSTLRKSEFTVRTVVIDAGHGGKDPGTSGSYTLEKDVALKVALKLGSYIEEYLPDVKVIYTRKDDRFVELHERANIANKNDSDIFISIHANSLPRNISSKRKEAIYGTETYVMGAQNSGRNFNVAKRENSVILLEEDYEKTYNFDPNSPESYILFSLTQSAFQDKSIALATKIQNQFAKRAGRRSLGVKQSSLLVLWSTAMPSVLVEIGYLSNPREEKELNDPSIQGNIASGIFRAFRDYKNDIESLN